MRMHALTGREQKSFHFFFLVTGLKPVDVWRGEILPVQTYCCSTLSSRHVKHLTEEAPERQLGKQLHYNGKEVMQHQDGEYPFAVANRGWTRLCHEKSFRKAPHRKYCAGTVRKNWDLFVFITFACKTPIQIPVHEGKLDFFFFFLLKKLDQKILGTRIRWDFPVFLLSVNKSQI